MKLSALFSEDHMLVQSEAETFEGLLEALLATFTDLKEKPAEAAAIRAKLMEREIEFPTFVTEGVCVAHLRLPNIKTFHAGIAIPAKPLDHPGDPEEQIKLLFLALGPQDQNTLMLQTLSAIARMLASPGFLKSVKGIKSEQRVIRLIEESGIDIKRNITAADIMEPVEHFVRLDTPLPEVIEILAKSKDEGLPVVDEKGRLAGEITSKELLQLGMPKYMDLLANPDMLNAFEPFENYFQRENLSSVREICRRDFVTVTPRTLIVQVAHLMITKNRRRVYVLEDDRLEGIIYRKSIVVRVMIR